MTKLTYVLAALLATAVLGCAALAYLWIDRSISLSYARQSVEASGRSIRNLEYLLEDEWRNMPEAEVFKKLQDAAALMPNAGVVVKKEEGVIWFDEVRFNFKQGELNSVGNPNEPFGNESSEPPESAR